LFCLKETANEKSVCRTVTPTKFHSHILLVVAAKSQTYSRTYKRYNTEQPQVVTLLAYIHKVPVEIKAGTIFLTERPDRSCLIELELALVHSVQQKSIGLKFSKSRNGSDVRYSCHHNASRFTFPIFAHSWRFSVFHSLQSITPRIYRVSQEEWTKLGESVPYVELYRYNPKHLYPKLNGYG